MDFAVQYVDLILAQTLAAKLCEKAAEERQRRKELFFARQRIAALEAALHKINAINDNPARFSKEIQDVLDSVIDTSDHKF